MPITYGTFTKQLKLLPLVLQADGGATVTVRYGFVGDDGVFTASTEQQIPIDAASVNSILSEKSMPGMSRRDDLSFAIYTYLVRAGLIEQGSIA